MRNPKATLVRFINSKGEWQQEVCHDVSKCREHSRRLLETKKILKLKPYMAEFDFDELDDAEDVMDVFSEQVNPVTDDTKLTDLQGLLAPNSNAPHSINTQLSVWKQMMPRVRPKGVSLEQLIDNALRAGGVDTGWDPESHKVSEDMLINLAGEDTSVSVKTGVWDDKKNTLTISGSRTGKHKTIEDKLAHLKGTSAEVYLLISGANSAKPEDPYYMITFRHEAIPFGEPEDWVETPSKWVYESETAVLEIRKTMSDQFWIKLKDPSLLTIQKLDV